MKMLTLLTCILTMSTAFATTKIREGSNGQFQQLDPNEILAKALTAPEVKTLLGNQEILSVSKNDFFLLSYEIKTTICVIQIVINFLEFATPIDGVAPIEVGINRYINVTPVKGISNTKVTTCPKI